MVLKSGLDNGSRHIERVILDQKRELVFPSLFEYLIKPLVGVVNRATPRAEIEYRAVALILDPLLEFRKARID